MNDFCNKKKSSRLYSARQTYSHTERKRYEQEGNRKAMEKGTNKKGSKDHLDKRRIKPS
jgi:hypothetical protein